MGETYDPKDTEPKWQKYWEDKKLYTFSWKDAKKNPKKIFSIDTPPPYLSGRMHIGHAFSYSQGDFIARYHRMKGEIVYYPFGTDDNGLPTERMVEKEHRVKATSMSREEFVKLCVKTLNEMRPAFTGDWKKLGISCDFEQTYSTISYETQKVSQLSFLELYEKGKVYRTDSPVLWCTHCQTAIAQAELIDKEMHAELYQIKFSVGGKEIIISTTRPELLGACVGVMVPRKDSKYSSLVGKYAKVPLFGWEVPIISDELVDPDFGTGAVMCCTFGDRTDVVWWHKHKLPLKVILNKDGKLIDVGAYSGMSLLDARKQIILDLEKNGILIGKKPLQHSVQVHDRCETALEIMKTAQWYIRTMDAKEELLELGRKIEWIPDFMRVRYGHWVENLNWDWCISRQRHFGVPFPVWYCKKCGDIHVADAKDLPIDPLAKKLKKKCRCGSSEFIGEKDVMDTWATSSVTPEIILHWADDKKQFEKMHPVSLRLQAHEIIRTWAFYTIVKSLYHHKRMPWKKIAISGYITRGGKKMSKSVGNVVGLWDVVDKYGVDCIRYWAAGSKLGEDIDYREQDVQTAKRTLIKLWNAARFCSQVIGEYNGKKPRKTHMVDAWLLHEVNMLVKKCTEAFESYQYSIAKREAEQFFWNTFCDYYLEIVKDRLYNKEREKWEKESAIFALYNALFIVLKLLAPFLVYLTEELYQQHYKKNEKEESIHLIKWPEYRKELVNDKAFEIGSIMKEIIARVRKIKSDKKIALSTPIDLWVEKDKIEKFEVADVLEDLKAVCKATSIHAGAFEVKIHG